MAKQYSAKITLQDNWTSVIDKAIKETQKLNKEFEKIKHAKADPKVTPKVDQNAMRAFKTDLKKLSSQKVNVGAKMDSSVHSVLNNINKRIVPNKTIRITAKDEVTRTVTNLERNIFTMQNRMNMGLRNPFGNMSISASGAQSKVSSLMNGLTALAGVSGLSRVAQASSLAPLLSAGAVGVMAGGISSRTTGMASKVPSARSKNPMRSFKDITSGAWSDTLNKAQTHMAGQWTDADMLKEYMPHISKAWDSDSSFANMIQNQKTRMSQLGVANYLPKYQNKRIEEPGGMSYDRDGNGSVDMLNNSTLFEGIVKSKGKVNKAISSMFSSMSSTVIPYATKAGNKITTILTNSFNKIEYSQFSKRAQAALSTVVVSATKAGTRIQFAFQRAWYGAASGASRLVIAASTATQKMKDAFNRLPAPVKNVMSKISSSINKVTGKTWNVTLRLNDGVSSGLKSLAGKITSVLKNAAIAGGVAIGAGLGIAAKTGMSGAMSLEQQKISMSHFMEFNDKQKNGGKGKMSGGQIDASVDKYIGNLRDLANVTPFGTNEVVTAGARAMNVMNGDTAGAMDLTKISADMASLNPGKSIQDAMEALADAKTGEFERLKEFGLKISQADFKASIGKGENDQLTPDETMQAYKKLMDSKLKPMFSGGSTKMSGTAQGLLSTIKGKAGSTLTDIGTMFLPQVKTGLSSVIDFMERVTPKILDFFEVLSGKKAATGNMAVVMNVMKQVGKVIGDVFTFAKDIVAQAMPTIAKLIENLTPTFLFLGDLVGTIMSAIGDKMGVVTKIIGYLGQVWADIFPTIQSVLETSWGIIKPIFDTLMSVASIIADIFILVWPGIQGAIEGLWAGIKPIFDLMSEALKGISEFAGWVAEKLDAVISKKEKTDNAAANPNASPKPASPNGRAVGMAYIPYNGYQASLHRGESILTRQEADAWREGRSGNKGDGLSVTVNVNGAADPHEVAKEVVSQIQLAAANM